MKKALVVLMASSFVIGLAEAQTVFNSTPSTVVQPSQPVTQTIAGYQIGQQGPNSRIWQKIVQTVDARGNTVLETNQAYVELATGLNFWRNGRWQPSKEEIAISPDGSSAVATNGQHQVYFPGNIYNGMIKLVAPDGKILQSQPLGLSYSDGSNSVLIAVLTNSTGELVGPNQVIYPAAFTDFKADLRYTYTRAGFEQDVVLREQPPDPVSLGLNPKTTRLQVLTEFFNPPQPSVTAITTPTDAGNLEDDDLGFGAMRMGRGKAFLLGTNSPAVGVNKRWLTLAGRQFLVEEVPIVSIASNVDTLPPITQTGSGTSKYIVSKSLILPPQRLTRTTPKTTFLAKATLPSRGLVLDYTVNGNLTNWTFQGDTTYYLSGPTYLYSTNTFEGGAVLKYTNNAFLDCSSATLNWQATAYRPVIFTAKDDRSVGNDVPSSTGTPTNYYANPAIAYNSSSGTLTLHNFRIAYAQLAVSAPGGWSVAVNLNDGQIVDCANGVVASYQVGVYLRNVLLANFQTALELGTANVRAENVTFDGNATNSVLFTGSACVVNLANCILADIPAYNAGPAAGGDHNGFYNSGSQSTYFYGGSTTFGTSPITSTTYPFQSVGAGNYYLTNGCVFLNAGTTDRLIFSLVLNDPYYRTLLADLKTKTTYPPILLSNVTNSVDTTLSPQTQRDTDTPDLGYHYDPIDYLVYNFGMTNATLTLTNGVAVACCNGAGIWLLDGSAIVSIGTPLSPNWIVRYQSVQEESLLINGAISAFSPNIYPYYTGSVGPNGLFRFTKMTCPPGSGYNIEDTISPYSYNSLLVEDCEVWNGKAYLGGAPSGVTTIRNNLFVRAIVSANGILSANNSLSFSNNLFLNTSVNLYPYSNTNTWSVFNNDFDTCTIGTFGQATSNGYNAYLNCNSQLYPTNAHDIVLTNALAYQTGPFGTFYQPTNSPLILKGSTNANLVGLFHYTVTTNEVVEGTNIVSIGYHYVATDTNGNLLSTPVDGIPDYVADANGNGLVDAGEISWTNYYSLNGLTGANGLVVFTPLK